MPRRRARGLKPVTTSRALQPGCHGDRRQLRGTGAEPPSKHEAGCNQTAEQIRRNVRNDQYDNVGSPKIGKREAARNQRRESRSPTPHRDMGKKEQELTLLPPTSATRELDRASRSRKPDKEALPQSRQEQCQERATNWATRRSYSNPHRSFRQPADGHNSGSCECDE